MSLNKFLDSVSRLAHSVVIPAISNASVYVRSAKTFLMARLGASLGALHFIRRSVRGKAEYFRTDLSPRGSQLKLDFV